MDSYFVRAFCSENLFGNPAAVCFVDEFPENKQEIAASINFSETVFVKPYKNDSFLIRWFSPKDEAPLCAHATVAAAYMIHKKYGISKMELIHRQGVILAHVDANDKVHLFMGKRDIKPLDVTEVYHHVLPPFVKEAYTDDIIDIFVLENEHDVIQYTPNREEIMKINKRAICLTASSQSHDYVCRYFFPRSGVLEDPFCGSVNCRIAPYWSSISGKKHLHSYQSKGCSEFIVHDDCIEIVAQASLFEERRIQLSA